jgi:secreted PhoX family phosphatase
MHALAKDPQGILDLPSGFSYSVLSRAGERMHDGYRVPGNPDAMGVFRVGSELVLMRNHEVSPGDRASGPYLPGMNAPKEAFDAEGYGGVTRIVLDPHNLAVQRQELALCGTHWNCAGGLSPWGWLSCEEIFAPGHGYVFLAPHAHAGLSQASPIKPYGRFRHEAASVDPQTLIAYLSEDREDAAFYRFVPDAADTPFKGRLQALRVLEQPRFDTSSLVVGKSVPIDWVDVPEPDPKEDNVRLQAGERGAARFARTEGLWLSEDELFVCATTGGPIGHGQILRITHRSSRPMLSVIAQSHDPAVLDMPDNITVSPQGEIVIAEDGLEGNYLRRVTRDGAVVDFARNALSSSELTGPCFAPDGQTLFVNLQRDGLTLAIRGPFDDELQRAPAAKSNSDTHASGPGFASVTAGLVTLSLAALMHRRRKLGATG